MSINKTLLNKGYKFRIYPTEEQKVFFEKTFGCCRKVYNILLTDSIEQYKLYQQDKIGKPKVSSYDFNNLLPNLKSRDDYIYLNEVSSKALQYSAFALGDAFKRFFKTKKGFPQFKSKHSNTQSFTLESYEPGAKYFHIKDKVLTIAKLDIPIKVVWHRELPSTPTKVTISKNPAGQYFASFLCKYRPEPTNGQGIVGIDLGIKTLATMSNGVEISNPKHYVKSQKKLTILQRRLSKKKKGSKNRDKARLKVARLHLKIANQRQDYLHKLSRSLVNDNQVIVIEDLHVKGMSRNHNLAKHILDGGFGLFRKMLEYKTIESSWCRLMIADRYYPSTQLCSACLVKPKVKIKLGVTQWTCFNCNSIHQRDDNASKNLEGLATRNPQLWLEYPGNIILCKNYEELM